MYYYQPPGVFETKLDITINYRVYLRQNKTLLLTTGCIGDKTRHYYKPPGVFETKPDITINHRVYLRQNQTLL